MSYPSSVLFVILKLFADHILRCTRCTLWNPFSDELRRLYMNLSRSVGVSRIYFNSQHLLYFLSATLLAVTGFESKHLSIS